MAGRPPVLAILAMLALAAPIVLLGAAHRGPAPGGGVAPVPGVDGAAARGDDRGGPVGDHRGPGAIDLAGTVVDASGAPIAGVTITAVREPGADAAPVPAAAIATTTGDGRFVLAGLDAGRHRLTVEGAAIFTAEVRAVAVPSDELRIGVARRVAIAGRVVDGGTAIAGATVELAGDSLGERRTATTGADGGFAFEPVPEGTFAVWAWQGDLAARAHRVARLGTGPFAPIELALEPAAIVVGRIVDRDGGAGVVAAVELRPLDAGSSGEPPRYARSGTDGVFRIEGVPHGRWTADGWSPGWVTAGTVELVAGRGAPVIELVAGGVIDGRVVDDQGRAIAGAAVRATAGGGGTAAAVGQGGATYSADALAEKLRRYSGMGPAQLAPAAAAPVLDPSGDDPRYVARGELGVLLGPIPYPPAPGARVSRQAAIVDVAIHGAVPAGAEPPPLPLDPARASIWITDADGRFRIAGLAPGTVTVRAAAPGFADGACAPVATGPDRAASAVTIALSPGAIVAGTVTDQHGAQVIGARVAIEPRDAADPARRIEAITGADGGYRIGPAAGAVALVVTAYAHADARIDLELVRPPAGAPAIEVRHDVVLAVADAVLTGTVEDPAGQPVRGATVTVATGPAAGRSAVTGDTGFRIDQLPPGPIAIRVGHADYPPRQLDVTTDAVARAVLPWGGGIAGTVIDHHTSAPVGGVVVTATGPGGARAEAAVAADGQFALAPLAPGAWRIAVEQPGYLAAARDVEVAAGDRAGAITVHDAGIELERGALLAGTVHDRSGAPVAAATVTARRASGDGPTVTTRTDADGGFHLRDAPSGALIVRATAGGRTGRRELIVAPGGEQLALDLELR